MNVTVELVNASGDRAVPKGRDFQRWAGAALHGLGSDAADCELSIRLVGEEESAQLNGSYRHKSGPTNILSFPAAPAGFADPCGLMAGVQPLLGDLAICVPVVKREAAEQGKTLEAHWAHLTVHGVLHLKGHDHEEEAAAELMEGLEVRILAELGFADPYL